MLLLVSFKVKRTYMRANEFSLFYTNKIRSANVYSTIKTRKRNFICTIRKFCKCPQCIPSQSALMSSQERPLAPVILDPWQNIL